MPAFVTRDKYVVPGHTYLQKEGHEDHPVFLYKDQKDNIVRYTNAPAGHKDNSGYHPEAKIHPSEPQFESAPDYFSPDGRKLTRAPFPGAEVQWNQSYHPEDFKNIWAGRWVNPATGAHEYTYLDSDVRNYPKLKIYFQNVLTDARIPYLRDYYHKLYKSPMLKDQIVGIMLALLDQGKFGTEELMTLLPGYVKIMGNLVQLGKRWIFTDHSLISTIERLIKDHHPSSPIFSVPFVKKTGDIDEKLVRIIGSHYMFNILEMHGMSLEGLFTYHASQIFSREVERLLDKHQVSWPTAVNYALEAVAADLGYDLTDKPDRTVALMSILNYLIDPMVVVVLKKNAEQLQLLNNEDMRQYPNPQPNLMPISMDLVTRTPSEEAFSKWLHSFPVHDHLDSEPPAAY